MCFVGKFEDQCTENQEQALLMELSYFCPGQKSMCNSAVKAAWAQ